MICRVASFWVGFACQDKTKNWSPHADSCLRIEQSIALTASPLRKEGSRRSTAKGETISMIASLTSSADSLVAFMANVSASLAGGNSGILHVLGLVV